MDYSKFTNLYSLTKTLKFELKPTEETKITLDKYNIIKKDENIDYLYHYQMKPMLDYLHKVFIKESLSHLVLDNISLQTFFDLYKEKRNSKLKSDKILDEKIKKITQELRNQIVKNFDTTADNWREDYKSKGIILKGKGYKILTESTILKVLRDIHFEDDRKLQAIQDFDKFFTYFSGFNKNRENYYTNKGNSTEIAFRIINQNLVRFIENIISFQEIKKEILKISEYQKYFELENYSKFIVQDDIDEYNSVIGGRNPEEEGDQKIQGINEKVNLYIQANSIKNKKIRLPKLKELYKQIASEKIKWIVFEVEFGSEWRCLRDLIQYQDKFINPENGDTKLQDRLNNFFNNWKEYDLENIYFNKASLNTISSKWFINWSILSEKIFKFDNKKKVFTEKDISLAEIKNALDNLDQNSFKNLFKDSYKEYQKPTLWESFLAIWQSELDRIFQNIEKNKDDLFEVHGKFSEDFNKTKHGELIKRICDTYLSLDRMLRYHKIKGEESGNTDFYEIFDKYLEETVLIKYYNAFRNYMSQKDYNQDKIKLNFENDTLLAGWDENKEPDNTSIIIKNDQEYELIILKKEFRHIFSIKKNPKLYIKDGFGIQKMRYKLLPGPNKMLPKVAFSAKNIKFFDPSEEVLKVYKQGTFKKENLVIEDLHTMIEFWKKVLLTHTEWKNSNWKFQDTKNYASIDKFYKEVTEQGYKIEFLDINKSQLERLESEEKIFRFKIQNKDFTNKDKTNKKNLSTIYFENLFSQENLNNISIKLNGEAEVFYRKGQKSNLKLKKDKQGKEVLDAKRYSEDKYFFHFPITINFKNQNIIKFKDFVTENILKNKNNITYLGIDRGEKHLAYYCLIDNKGKILKQGSFNIINGVDYASKLDKRAKEMMDGRQNWQTIGNIKNFKEGYLSQVIHEIYQIVVSNNALIVLEDLNTEFKAKRTAKVEKSVYKKFEVALAKKLNHLVIKDKAPTEVGGVLNAYQLTPAIPANDIGKFERSREWGIMQYVQAAYTSTTDPITSWRKNIYLKKGTNETMRDQILKLRNIEWDLEKQCYVITYNPIDFVTSNKVKVEDKEYQIYTCVDRLTNQKDNKHHWHTVEYFNNTDNSITNNLTRLFEDNYIVAKDRIIDQITEQDSLSNGFYSSLIYYLNLVLQIRNSKTGSEIDFIQSPVYSDKIQGLFDSRKYQEYKEKFDLELPENGDANGAYHIALRGLERVKDLI